MSKEKDIQQWGDEQHRICYKVLTQEMKESYPDVFDVEGMELPISFWGADEYFNRFFKGKFPVEVEEVILKACRHVEYRLLTDV